MRSVILTLGVAVGLLGFAGTGSAQYYHGGHRGHYHGHGYGGGYGGGFYRPGHLHYHPDPWGGHHHYHSGRYYSPPIPRYSYGFPGYGYGGGYGYPRYGYGGYGGYRPGFSFGLTIVR